MAQCIFGHSFDLLKGTEQSQQVSQGDDDVCDDHHDVLVRVHYEEQGENLDVLEKVQVRGKGPKKAEPHDYEMVVIEQMTNSLQLTFRVAQKCLSQIIANLVAKETNTHEVMDVLNKQKQS